MMSDYDDVPVSHRRQWVTAASGDSSTVARALILCGASLTAVSLQVVCGGLLDIGGVRPDLLLAVVVAAGLLGGWRYGVIAGLVTGWCVWALSPEQGGGWFAWYGMIGWCAGIVSHPFSRDSLWWHAVLVFAAAIMVGSVVCINAAISSGVVVVGGAVSRWLLLSSLYSAVVAVPVFALLRRAWSWW